METKICRKCKIEKPIDNFGVTTKNKDGRNGQCKPCVNEYYQTHKDARIAYYRKYHAEHREKENQYSREYFQKNKEKRREYANRRYKENPDIAKKYAGRYVKTQRANIYRYTYGITVEQYEALLEQQNGVCAICGNLSGKKRLFIDHDHKTGKIRGLLCMYCNFAIGHARDDVSILEKIINYLKEK